jgi:ammonia channel protein AmtB
MKIFASNELRNSMDVGTNCEAYSRSFGQQMFSFYGTWKLISELTKKPATGPDESPVHTVTSCSFKIHFANILHALVSRGELPKIAFNPLKPNGNYMYNLL